MAHYGTISGSSDYMSENYFTRDAWVLLDDNKKTQALSMATKAIENLNFVGTKTVSTQALEFPRDDETVIPDAILFATYECAYAFAIEQIDIEFERRKAFGKKRQVQSVNTHFDDIPVYFRNGIPSSLAWDYLLPYLIDPNELRLTPN